VGINYKKKVEGLMGNRAGRRIKTARRPKERKLPLRKEERPDEHQKGGTSQPLKRGRKRKGGGIENSGGPKNCRNPLGDSLWTKKKKTLLYAGSPQPQNKK